MSHEVMVLMKVEEDADYGVIRDNIGDFPEVVEVSAPIPVFGKQVILKKKKDRLIGWNNYHCNNCLGSFKSHYEKHACPACQSTDIYFECYSVHVLVRKEVKKL